MKIPSSKRVLRICKNFILGMCPKALRKTIPELGQHLTIGVGRV
jgi:hypothetical protein